jgi:hypothetical protein
MLHTGLVYMLLSCVVSHCPTVLLPLQIHVTLLDCVPLSHCLTAMTNTCHSLWLCPTVPQSYYHFKYMSLSFTVSHCPTLSLPQQLHLTIFNCVPLSHCIRQQQLHLTLFYCVPLSHSITAGTNTSPSVFSGVPLSHSHTATSNTCHSILLCPTVSLQW